MRLTITIVLFVLITPVEPLANEMREDVPCNVRCEGRRKEVAVKVTINNVPKIFTLSLAEEVN